MNRGLCICGSCRGRGSAAVPGHIPGSISSTPWGPRLTSLDGTEGRSLPRAWQTPVKLLGGAAGAHRVLGHLWFCPLSVILGD